MDRLDQSYRILDELRLTHGLYLASPSEDYSYVWLRDSFYEVLPYLHEDCGRYEQTYHRVLDLFKQYEWKIAHHAKERPSQKWQYIHARYSADSVSEIDEPWGHAQHDAIGAILFGIGTGIQAGRQIIRDDSDVAIIQLIVDYIGCCEFWHDPDNGMWEENEEVHMSSVGACVAGLQAIDDTGLVHVPGEWIQHGYDTIDQLFPRESATKSVDLAQLSLIYPYDILSPKQAKQIIAAVEAELVRSRGVIRYRDDSYYSTKEADYGRHLPPGSYVGTEAEWSMGFPWLSLCALQVTDENKAIYYLDKAESVMLRDGSLPELFYAHSRYWNGNTPLGWSNALFILAKEALDDRK